MTDMAAVAPNPRVTGAMRYVRKGTRSAVAVPHRYAYHLERYVSLSVVRPASA